MTALLPLLLLAGPVARAVVPLPLYPGCGTVDRPDLCPSELGYSWELISYIPPNARDSVRPGELEMGSGVSADLAWRTTTGRFDVLLAFGDSGISWQETDLVNKIYLNTGELPLPRSANGRTSDSYDLDGNGLVNVQDYAEDERVSVDAGRDAADGMLDASDLIYTFTDGEDDDGNGYVDDISGWDFFGRDNDAWNDMTEGYGDHGTGVMEEAAAEGENGGGIGVCPNCAVLPIRISDEIVSDGTRVAEAIAFAVDSGAVSINLATGALSSPSEARAAVRYALDTGMSIVAVTGDENAYHHNFPAMLDGVLYIHSVRYNGGSSDGAVYSYTNTWNCNNYGMRLDFVAPSSACATGSSAVTSGAVGLLQSAARDVGTQLSVGEVTQLLKTTSDDIFLTEAERERSGAYPSDEGWDAFFGYGRIDVGEAVSRVQSGDIPPVPVLDSPVWFQWVPGDEGKIAIEGSISADRADGYTWSLAVGVGYDPREWYQIAAGEGSAPTEGVLADLDLASLPASVWVPVPEPDDDEGIVERMRRVYGPAVTLRLRARDDAGREGEDRKTFFVQQDDTMLPGFPIDLGESAEASPVLADLDGDGILEILLASSGGTVWAVDGEGRSKPGWPVQTEPIPDSHPGSAGVRTGAMPEEIGDGTIATPAVGDLDGDGSPEVVAATGRGAIYAWHADGSRVENFPVWNIGRAPEEFDGEHGYDQGFGSAPTLVDLDGDGTLEILAAGLDQRLYVFTADGLDWGPYPITVCHPELCDIFGTRIVASPTVGDADGDGDMDIALGTNEAVQDGAAAVAYLYDADSATLLDGWPLEVRGTLGEVALLPVIGSGHPASLAMADLDGDGTLELANPIMLGQADIVHHDGSLAVDIGFSTPFYGENTNTNAVSMMEMMSNPAFGDLDGDGTPDLAMGGGTSDYLLSIPVTSWVDFQLAIGAWSGATGEMLRGFPRQVEDLQFLTAPAIADIDGDGDLDAVYGSAGYVLHAWDADGNSPADWPKFLGQWMIGSPAVGDIDGDGYFDVVAATREGTLFAWSTAGPADGGLAWASMHHDAANTGNYEMPLPSQLGPSADEGGTGCCADEGSSASAWLLAPLLALGAVRRRRVR